MVAGEGALLPLSRYIVPSIARERYKLLLSLMAETQIKIC